MSLMQAIGERQVAQRAAQHVERRQSWQKDEREKVQGQGRRPGPRQERQRRLKVDGKVDSKDKIIVIDLHDNFEQPTDEMTALWNDIKRSRLQTVRAYGKLFATRSNQPNFRSLEKFREVVLKVTLLENRYNEMKIIARRLHEAKRAEVTRAIFEHQDKPAKHQYMPLGRILETNQGRQETLRDETEARKAKAKQECRHRRQIWRRRHLENMASQIRDTAEEAFAEDEMSSETFRQLTRAMEELQETDNPVEVAAAAFADDLIDREQFSAIKWAGSI